MTGNGGVTVVVVTWNSAEVIEGFVDAIGRAAAGIGSWELIVSDNASTDDTLGVVERLRSDVRVVAGGSNAGYSAGINRGLEARRFSGPVVVANPDTRPAPGSLSRLLAALDRPGVGLAVPRLVDEAGRTSRSLRRAPTVGRAVGEAVLGGTRAGRIAALGEVVTDEREYLSGHCADWATGAFMAISSACAAAVGEWDESFFLYSEETDYALRARDLGFDLWFEPTAVVEHIGGDSRVSPLLYALVTVNKVELFARRHGRLPVEAFRAAHLLKEAVRSARGEPHRTARRALLGRIDPRRELQR